MKQKDHLYWDSCSLSNVLEPRGRTLALLGLVAHITLILVGPVFPGELQAFLTSFSNDLNLIVITMVWLSCLPVLFQDLLATILLQVLLTCWVTLVGVVISPFTQSISEILIYMNKSGLVVTLSPQSHEGMIPVICIRIPFLCDDFLSEIHYLGDHCAKTLTDATRLMLSKLI